jgi:subtilisin family serine protease
MIVRIPATALVLAVVLALAGALVAPAGGIGTAGGSQAASAKTQRYVVLYAKGATLSDARAAIKAAGGRIVRENERVGLATVDSANRDFIAAAGTKRALRGAAHDRSIGTAPNAGHGKDNEIERLDAERRAFSGQPTLGPIKKSGPEPLSWLQWDMSMIGATSDGSYDVQRGDDGVLVGIIDTGIDGSHPDIAPNFNAALSRNFTVDIPLVDGPCEEEPDGSCNDAANVDENGHGTHVAGTVASPINGFGMSGVAPGVTLVNLRAGQDSGYFFLQPSVDALTYAADNGVDVVNMSYYIDPWLYNCAANPADSPAAQAEQQLIVEATNRALDYAWGHGVTLIGAAGNSATDLGHPTFDDSSPDYPPGAAYERTVDNSCLDMPTEGNHVLSITAVGPSTAKADYSNYGLEQATVAAPGGYFRDFVGTKRFGRPENLILGPYPESVALGFGEINNGGGVPNNPFVVRECTTGVGHECAYYQLIQGTSMASPHAVGVAALIISEFGITDPVHGGLMMSPADVEARLMSTATEHACPDPRLVDYTLVGRPASWNAFCEGDLEFNGFYGHGIVNASDAVSAP